MVAPYSPAETSQLLQLCVLNAVEETHTDCQAVGIAGVYTQLQKARRARKERTAEQHSTGRAPNGDPELEQPARSKERRCYWVIFGPTRTNSS